MRGLDLVARRSSLTIAVGAYFALQVIGCSDRGSPLAPLPPAHDPGPATVSFAADIQPILTDNCAPCHGPPSPQNNMNLSSAVSWTNLVNVVSFEFAPALRVVPFDTTASVMYHKIAGDGVYGPQMPFGGSLQTAERVAIRTWILEGARDN